MKVKALQFGKAMSAALFVLLLSVAGMKNALAQNLVVTLQHGSDISMYYGTNAFVQAHEAAQTGDIITLSSGTFNPTTITKAITLRGAGCCMDTVTSIYPTVFESSITANVPDEDHSLIIEGICFNNSFYCHNLNNPKFIKCNFDYFSNSSGYLMQYAQFINCYFDWYSMSDVSHHVQFTNCYVKIQISVCTNEHNISFVNSIVYLRGTGTIETVLAINSIFYYFNNSGWFTEASASSSCLFTNCVEIIPVGYSGELFANQMNNTTNISMEGFPSVFETFIGTYGTNFSELINERFILKSDFASSFLGNDGTEVGIHGGQAPYNPRPNYMVLKQCNVAGQSTIDNKLSVEIQVVAEGE